MSAPEIRSGEFTFLMCSERSGSNLISRMFDAHPDVCGPTPTHLVRLLAEHRDRYGDLEDDREWQRLLTDAADILATMIGPWHAHRSRADLESYCDERSLTSLLCGVFRAEARAAGKPHLFIKENHLHRYLAFVQRAFPGARIVAMVRDPRDMALSWKNSPILRGDVVRAARVWREDQEQLARVLGWLVPGQDIHLMTYEGLVSDPEVKLQAACAFLGLTPDPAMLAYYVDDATADAAAASDDWKNVARPVMSCNFGKWREGLTPTEAAYVERVCAEPMAAFGYMPETGDPRTLLEMEAELLPLERYEKPGWQEVSAEEKRLRGERVAVMRRLDKAPLARRDGEPVHA